MVKAKFDRQEVIDKATQLFWLRGYQATSMQNLTKVTGLKPGSIYLAFGSKDAMFDESLARYAQQSKRNIVDTIEKADTVLSGIRSILLRMVDQTTKKAYCSCFLIKSQLELAETAQPLYKKASEYLAEIEALYCSYLSKTMSAELAKTRATSLMLHIFGMRVYGYQNKTKQEMIAGLKAGLSWLDWDEHS